MAAGLGKGFDGVAPHAGAWIEMSVMRILLLSLTVAPHAGAWIEIIVAFLTLMDGNGRTPCGCVD